MNSYAIATVSIIAAACLMAATIAVPTFTNRAFAQGVPGGEEKPLLYHAEGNIGFRSDFSHVYKMNNEPFGKDRMSPLPGALYCRSCYVCLDRK